MYRSRYRFAAASVVLAGILVCLLLFACSGDPTGVGGSGTPPPPPPPANTALAFASQPAADWATKPMPPFVVTARDAAGRTVGSFTGPVALTLSGGAAGAVLTGTRVRQAINGVATFNDVAVDRAGAGYQLTAAANGLTPATSANFNVGAAPHLVFTTQPSSYRTDQPIAPAIQVTLQDSTGATVGGFGGSVALSVAGPGAPALLGALQVTASHGVAVFTNVTLPTEGAGFTLTAASPYTVSGTSAPLESAPSLKFEAFPASIPSGAVITPAIQVALRSASGAIVTTFNDAVSLALETNGSAATLGGTTTVNAVAGVATFSDLSVGTVGTYTLRATTAAYSGARLSQTFTVTCAQSCWRTLAAMPTPLWGPAVAVVNGKVYAAGGVDANYYSRADLQSYDPASGTWQQLVSMGTPRGWATAAALNGRLYVIGRGEFDSASATMEMYDPATNAWTPRAPIPDGRANFGVGVGGGRLYVLGGTLGSPNGASYSVLSSTLAYDPTTDSWSAGPAMPGPLAYMAVAQVGGLIASVGGSANIVGTPTGAMEFLDPASGTWTPGPAIPDFVNGMHAVATDNVIYVTGSADDYGRPEVERYDVSARTWSFTAPVPASSSAQGVAVAGGALFVLTSGSGLATGSGLMSYTPLP